MAALWIRQDYSPANMRKRTARERDRRSLAALDPRQCAGRLMRAEAARVAWSRQARHDTLQRFNERPDSLYDRPYADLPGAAQPGPADRPQGLYLRGPKPERDGVSAGGLVEFCAHVERTYGDSIGHARRLEAEPTLDPLLSSGDVPQ